MSLATVHLAHDLFHLLENSIHLHDHTHSHHEHHEQHEQHNRIYTQRKHDDHSVEKSDRYKQIEYHQKEHGHNHNPLVDTMLRSIENRRQTPGSHHIYVMEMFYHLYYSALDCIENLYPDEHEHFSKITHFTSLCCISPPTPPPRIQ